MMNSNEVVGVADKSEEWHILKNLNGLGDESRYIPSTLQFGIIVALPHSISSVSLRKRFEGQRRKRN